MDFLPVDIMAWDRARLLLHNWRIVPTATSTRRSRSRFGLVLMIFFNRQVKGLGGWIHELVCTPFGTNPLLWPANILFNLVEYISKPLSHSLRLYGNMYAGEIIFLLLGLWAAGLVAPVFGLARPGLGDLPHPDRRAAGFHLHDAHRRLSVDGARASLASITHSPTSITKGRPHGKAATAGHDPGLHRHRHRPDHRPRRAGACIGIGIMCSRFLEGAARQPELTRCCRPRCSCCSA